MLAARTQRLQMLIDGCTWSIDTVQILADKSVTDHYPALQDRAAGRVIEPKPSKRWGFCSIRLHHPPDALLRYIADRIGHHVHRFDIAYDFVTPDPVALKALLDLTLTQPWRGQRATTTVADKRYWGPAWHRRNFVTYPKRDGVRLELRIYRKEACENHGIFTVSDLRRLDDAAVAALLDHEVRISVMNWERAKLLIADEARDYTKPKRLGFDHAGLRRRFEHRLCVLFSTEEGDLPDWDDLGNVPAQDITDTMPFLSGALLHQRAKFLLPPRARARLSSASIA
jgi:hypothetical protein